jgi:hypothetical protein
LRERHPALVVQRQKRDVTIERSALERLARYLLVVEGDARANLKRDQTAE